MSNENTDPTDQFIKAVQNTDFSDESTIRQSLRRDLLTREVRRAPQRSGALNAFALGVIVLGLIIFGGLVSANRPTSVIPAAPESQAEATPTPEGWWHVVQEGEDLKCIVEQFGWSGSQYVAQTVELNGLESADDIEVGQTLLIPTPEPFPSDAYSAAEASAQVGYEVLSPAYVPANLKLNSFAVHDSNVYTGYIYWGNGRSDGSYLIIGQSSPAMPLDQLVPILPDNQETTTLSDVSVRGQQGKYFEYSDPPPQGCLRQHEYHNLVWTEGNFNFEIISGQHGIDELMQVAESLAYDPNAPTLEAPIQQEASSNVTSTAPPSNNDPSAPVVLYTGTSPQEASIAAGFDVLLPPSLMQGYDLDSYQVRTTANTTYVDAFYMNDNAVARGNVTISQWSPPTAPTQMQADLGLSESDSVTNVSVRDLEGSYFELKERTNSQGAVTMPSMNILFWNESYWSFYINSATLTMSQMQAIAESLPSSPTVDMVNPIIAKTIGDPFTKLRAAPSIDQDTRIIAEVPPGTELLVLGQWVGYDWYMVQRGDSKAWVYANLVTIIGDASLIPSVEPPASVLPTPTAGMIFLYNEADVDQVEQMAGFDVLQPTFMPDRYKFEKYDVNSGDGRISVNTYYAYRAGYAGSDPLGDDVLYIWQSKSEDDNLEELANTFGEDPSDHPREQTVTEITVNGVDGYYVVVAAEGETYLEQRAVLWRKDGFSFAVYTLRATFEELIQIAESLQ